MSETNSFLKSPLENCDPEPVWTGSEEDMYAPKELEHKLNTSHMMVNGEFHKASLAYDTYLHERLAWSSKYADYNGLTKKRNEERNKSFEEQRYYKFCLGEKARECQQDFLKEYPNKQYRNVIYRTGFGDVIDCEVVEYKLDKNGNRKKWEDGQPKYKVIARKEIYNNI